MTSKVIFQREEAADWSTASCCRNVLRPQDGVTVCGRLSGAAGCAECGRIQPHLVPSHRKCSHFVIEELFVYSFIMFPVFLQVFKEEVRAWLCSAPLLSVSMSNKTFFFY